MDLIYFTGSWSDEDRLKVEAAVDAFEAAREGADGERMVGQPWTVSRHPAPSHRPLVTAARYRLGTMLTARDADELADRIHSLAGRPAGGSRPHDERDAPAVRPGRSRSRTC